MSEVTSERQIVITDSAARRIAALKAQEEAGDAFLRIAVSGGGDVGQIAVGLKDANGAAVSPNLVYVVP